MKRTLRIAVGVVAVVLVILQLPDAVFSAGLIFGDTLFLQWPNESQSALACLPGWLTAALWLGLAFVSGRARTRVLFGVAALIEAALNLDDFFMLANVLIVASVAPEHLESVHGLPVWLYSVPLFLAGVALLVDDDSLKWLGWAALAAVAVDVVMEFTPSEVGPDGSLPVTALDQVLTTGRFAAYLALLSGLAFWSFRKARSGVSPEPESES